jgi:hypothetical protein
LPDAADEFTEKSYEQKEEKREKPKPEEHEAMPMTLLAPMQSLFIYILLPMHDEAAYDEAS